MAQIITPFGYPARVALQEVLDSDPKEVVIVHFGQDDSSEVVASVMPLERLALAVALLNNHLQEILSGTKEPRT